MFVGYKNWLKNDDLQLIKLSILLTARKKKKNLSRDKNRLVTIEIQSSENG